MIVLNDTHIISPTIFPDQTSQVWQLPEDAIQITNRICWNFQSEDELFHLCQLKDLLDAAGSVRTTLQVDYLPYARQDKEVGNKSSFALHTFARILNSCNFDAVRYIDGHSSVAKDLIDNAQDRPAGDFILAALEHSHADTVAFPDEGASLRYHHPQNCPPIIGDKVRCPTSGHIFYKSIKGNPAGKSILIVDDICDGGMTFILFARELIDRGAHAVHLYVTHGIFSKGLKPLREAGIHRIYTMNGKVT